jgi:hypothetical protein
MTHIYDWLDEPANDEQERLAKEWIRHYCRFPLQKDHGWLYSRVLSCEYRGQRYRCTGASRLGDLWLARDFTRQIGYDLRVDVAECGAWDMKLREGYLP